MTSNGETNFRYISLIIVFILIGTLGISHAYAKNQTTDKNVSEMHDLSFSNPFVAITTVGVLSLVISLIVFSVGTNLRTNPKDKGFTIEEIFVNLEKLKNKVGEPAFSNLINGLSSAAKEELVFPEPIGVLRHKEFRRAITISVTLVYFALVGYSAFNPEESAKFNNNPVVQSFAWVFVAVMAFYFGDKIFEYYAKNKGAQLTASLLEPITIEEAKVSQDGKKLTVKIKNNLKSKIKVTNILVDDTPPSSFETFEIEGEKSESKDYDMETDGKTVKVEVGQVTAEKEIKTSKEGKVE